MKKLGIIGGIGPEATMSYYDNIIKGYQQRVDSLQTLPEIVINSINMYHMFSMLEREEYDGVAAYLVEAVRNLQRAGADFALMCGNTPHIVFNEIQEQVDIPLLSIVSPTLEAARSQGLTTLGLLGTKFTMQHDFFAAPLRESGIRVVTPSADEQNFIHQTIVDELENGIVLKQTKQEMIRLISAMIDRNHLDGIILGCTELPLLLHANDLPLAVLDIAELHIRQAIAEICG
ncbi:MAG: amino acid racemase [Bifidobacterium sp.]|jgi:aspartate racemase|nr:amino acid racemase [Bifidobacterium sp.]MCH4174235.1 amino acid racemase [Bifidobacterium sp.]